ncbi:hypothetical protein GGI07_003079 [Coemansia sp. Benny D115]|nr:hypothetical protein GGI07_003079 [Coemansia sp. Benny D115]
MSQESMEIVRQLVAVVARTFYKDEFVIALDYLNRHEIARHDVLTKYMHVTPKVMFWVYSELHKHKLVRKIMRKDDPGENSRYVRRGPQTYFYLDYRQFVDVVKWRMWTLQEQIKEKMQKEQQNLGYECPGCGKLFKTMDVLSLVDMTTGLFKCDYCGDELLDNTESEIAQKSQRELSRFMDQFHTIIGLLKKTDSITLPPPTPLSEVPVPNIGGDQNDETDGRSKSGAGKELNVSRDTGLSSGNTVIEFGPDLTPKEAARLREGELAKKMRQNQLPAWHIWSTVSGVQMVDDNMISPEAEIKHMRYVERQNLRASRWNKREKERAKAALRELEERLRSLADGQGSGSGELRDEQVEAQRELFYQDFYKAMAETCHIEIPRDPRENYQKLIDQLASDELIEKAEAEKRRVEMERIEKERKEAAAAQSAERAKQGGSYHYRSKFNPHYSKYGRSAHRTVRRTTHRLFEFIDSPTQTEKGADGAEKVSEKIGGKKGEKELSKDASQGSVKDGVPTTTADGQNHIEGAADASEHKKNNGAEKSDDDNNSNNKDNEDNDDGDDVYDPYAMGIYALPAAKRRRFGLDDAVVAEMMEYEPESIVMASFEHVPNIDVFVGGKAKPIGLVTPQDEEDMSLDEYTDYWNAWRRIGDAA